MKGKEWLGGMYAPYMMSLTLLTALTSSLHCRDKWAEKEEWLRGDVARCSCVTLGKNSPWNPLSCPWGTASRPPCALRLYVLPWGPPQNSAQSCQPSGALSAEAQRSAFYTVGDKRFPALALEEEFFVRPCRRRRHDKEAGEGSAGS